jgi:hypothetical protein
MRGVLNFISSVGSETTTESVVERVMKKMDSGGFAEMQIRRS